MERDDGLDALQAVLAQGTIYGLYVGEGEATRGFSILLSGPRGGYGGGGGDRHERRQRHLDQVERHEG